MGRTLNDGLISFHTKLGERSGARKYGTAKILSPNYLLNLYKSNWIVKKYVDKTAQDMTKKWRKIQSNEFQTDELSEFIKQERKLNIKEIVEESVAWASLFGDVLVLAITDIHDEFYITPLNLEKEEIKRFVVIDRRGFQLGGIDDDVTSSNFGNPVEYTITGSDPLKVHHTRVHRIKAGKQPFSESSRAKYGVSDINATYETIKQFDSISASVDDLTEESNVDVLMVEGLNDQIDSGREDNVLGYAEITKRSKSASNMMLIDKKNGYDQKQVNFGGLSDIWVKAGNVLAGALDRPVTVLFGQSASGFNSGEEDNKNYYDTINALQESRMRPLLDFIDQFIFDLMKKKPLDWWYEFPTLDTMTDLDQSQIFSNYANAFSVGIQNSFITESQAMKELKQKAIIENITEEDIKNAEGISSEAGSTFGTQSPNSQAQSLAAAYKA